MGISILFCTFLFNSRERFSCFPISAAHFTCCKLCRSGCRLIHFSAKSRDVKQEHDKLHTHTRENWGGGLYANGTCWYVKKKSKLFSLFSSLKLQTRHTFKSPWFNATDGRTVRMVTHAPINLSWEAILIAILRRTWSRSGRAALADSCSHWGKP